MRSLWNDGRYWEQLASQRDRIRLRLRDYGVTSSIPKTAVANSAAIAVCTSLLGKEVLGVNNAAQAIPKQLGEKNRRPHGTMVDRGVDY